MSQPDPTVEIRLKPSPKKTLKRAFRDIYDRLGSVLAVSFLCFLAFIIPMSLGYQAAATLKGMAGAVCLISGSVIGLLIASPLMAGAYVWARNVASYNDPSPMDLLEGFHKWFFKSWKLIFSDLLMTVIVLINLVFYLRFPSLPVKIIGVIWAYGALFWLLSLTYHFPILIEQDAGVLKTWKRALLLVLDNLPFTLINFFVIISITGILVATVIGWPVLGVGMVSLFQTHALKELFRKYGLIEPEPDLPTEDKWRGIQYKD